MKIEKISDLFCKTGKLNSALIRRNWFLNSPFWGDIVKTGVSLGGDPLNASEMIYLYQNKMIRPNCEFCDELVKFNKKLRIYENHCGSRNCAAKASTPKRIETNLSRYGSKVSKNTIDSAKSRAGELNRKGRDTLNQKYGVNNPGQLIDHRTKSKQTLLDRWNVDHPGKIPSIVTKRNKNSINFYSSLCTTVQVTSVRSNPTNLLESPCPIVGYHCLTHGEGFLPSETFKWRAKKYDTVCTMCLRPYLTGSIAQNEIATFVESLGFKITYNDRQIIAPYELDIVIEEKKIAIEYHGLYWHSSDECPDRNQHTKKIDLLPKDWILLQIFEDEWNYQRDIVKSIIRSKLGATNRIFARACKISEISMLEANEFLTVNHLQGGSNNGSIHVGLKFNNELVAIAIFTEPDHSESELLRFSSKLNTTIVGGLSKLINAVKLSNVVSYIDRRYSKGLGFNTVGFQQTSFIDPTCFYTNLEHRFDINEIENKCINDFRIVYDAGKIKLKRTI